MSETEEKEEFRLAKGELRKLDAGEAVICRQGKGWARAQIKMLEE